MSLAQTIFFAIDYVFDPFQNPRKQMKSLGNKVSCAKDILYNDKYPENCLMDTYVVPRKNAKYPVIIEIHGGGFVAGDKKYRSYLSSWYAVNTGAFVCNLNYGLAPKVSFPRPIYELSGIFDWLYDNAEELNLDLDKIIITGDSAGGYYSAYLSALSASKRLQDRLDIHPKIKLLGAVINCGIFDMDKALKNKSMLWISGSICQDFTGLTLNDLEGFEYFDVISPMVYVGEGFPQSFVVYAKKDVFCKGQGQALLERLDELGIYNDHYGSKSFFDNHTYSLTWSSRAAKATNKRILEFINNLYYGQKEMPKEEEDE